MSKSTKNTLNNLTDKWDNLSSRDKLALVFLSLFLFAIFGVFGGWKVHQQATKQQATFNKKLTEFFWLRSQSSNLKTPSANAQNNSNQTFNLQVSQVIQLAGVQNPKVAGSNDSVQFNFQHSSQALVSKVITDMQNKGWKLTRLSIQQQNSGNGANGQSFQVQGSISAVN